MSKRFYSSVQRTEPDMRFEFDSTMDGVFPEIPKKQVIVLRKMRRSLIETSEADLTKFPGRRQNLEYFVPGQGYLSICACVDKKTQEPDLDMFCPVCQGEGYLWDELFIDGYKKIIRSDVGGATKERLITPGLTNLPLVVFYTRSSVQITKSDKIVEVWVDEEGKVIRPYRRKALYRIGTPVDLRSDDGKLEYWKVDVYEEQRRFLNGPKGG